jgi:hypothetical protein
MAGPRIPLVWMPGNVVDLGDDALHVSFIKLGVYRQ